MMEQSRDFKRDKKVQKATKSDLKKIKSPPPKKVNMGGGVFVGRHTTG
jgi:hypothetical protein